MLNPMVNIALVYVNLGCPNNAVGGSHCEGDWIDQGARHIKIQDQSY